MVRSRVLPRSHVIVSHATPHAIHLYIQIETLASLLVYLQSLKPYFYYLEVEYFALIIGYRLATIEHTPRRSMFYGQASEPGLYIDQMLESNIWRTFDLVWPMHLDQRSRRDSIVSHRNKS